jgi:hypothetical protein
MSASTVAILILFNNSQLAYVAAVKSNTWIPSLCPPAPAEIRIDALHELPLSSSPPNNIFTPPRYETCLDALVPFV